VRAPARKRSIHGVTAQTVGTGSWSCSDWPAIIAAVLVVGGPALFTSDGFALDFTNHLWLVSVQEHAIAHWGVPTYFLNAVSSQSPPFTRNQTGN
jgi:hypothetical protein